MQSNRLYRRSQGGAAVSVARRYVDFVNVNDSVCGGRLMILNAVQYYDSFIRVAVIHKTYHISHSSSFSSYYSFLQICQVVPVAIV